MGEAELKHARLAMLAAAGWPLAELWDTGIAKTFGLEPIIEENGGRAVSVLNGGMGMISPVYWVSVVLFAGAVEALSEYKGPGQGRGFAVDAHGVVRAGRPRLRPARALHDLREIGVGEDAHGDGGDQEREVGHARDHYLRARGGHHEEPGRAEQCVPLRAVLEDGRESDDVQPGPLLPIRMFLKSK